MLIPASEYIALLRKKADDIEWETGDFARADTLRQYANEIEASGERWVPAF